MHIRNILIALAISVAQYAPATIIQFSSDRVDHGMTPEAEQLWRAAAEGNLDGVKAVVTPENVASYNATYRAESDCHASATPLHLAARHNNVDMIQELIDNKAIINARDAMGQTPLHIATQWGSLDALERLIRNGADTEALDSEMMAPIHVAVSWNARSAAACLIRHGARTDVLNHYKRAPLHMAIMRGKREAVDWLIQLGADIDCRDGRQGATPLHYAVRKNNRSVTSALLEAGADAQIIDSMGGAPLHYAVIQNNRAMLELFIQHGEQLNVKTDKGETPLHYAMKTYNYELAELLMRCGAHTQVQDISKQTPLHYAVKRNMQYMVDMLIAHGACIDAQDEKGRTPLHTAVKYDSRGVAVMLIAHGAHLSREDFDGKTPANMAENDTATLVGATAPGLTQENTPREIFRSANASEDVSVQYVIMAASQGCITNAKSLLRFLTRDEQRARVALWAIQLQLYDTAKYSDAVQHDTEGSCNDSLSNAVQKAIAQREYNDLAATSQQGSTNAVSRSHALSMLCDELLGDANICVKLARAMMHEIHNHYVPVSLLEHLVRVYRNCMVQYRNEHGNTLLHEMARFGIDTGCDQLIAALYHYYFKNPCADTTEQIHRILQNASKKNPLTYLFRESLQKDEPLAWLLRPSEEEALLLDRMLQNAYGETPRDIAYKNTSRKQAHRYHNFIQAYDEAIATCVKQDSLYHTLKREQNKALLSDISIITDDIRK